MSRRKPKPVKPAITLAALESSAEFAACNANQQHWLRELVTNGFDYTAATDAAFQCADRNVARIRSYAVRKSPTVRSALALLLGKSESDLVHENQQAQVARLLREINRHLRAAEPGSVAAQRLLSQKQSLIKDLSAAQAPTAPRFHIGEILTQDGTDYLVTGIEPNGDPITREIGPAHAI